jgi:hypothetical protein
MEPSNFVKEMAKLAPGPTDLEKSGMSESGATRLKESFRCIKREHPLRFASGSDKLLELLREWDLRNIEVGMIRFTEPPIERFGKIYFGCVEADPLLILPGTNEIVVHEFGTEENLLWLVAKSGSDFLAALLIAARFLEERGSGRITFEDQIAANTVALECAKAAGGDRYSDFYKMLVG